MHETTYPADKAVDEYLTKKLVEGIDEFRNIDIFDKLNFLNSVPELSSQKWYELVPKWKNGNIVRNELQKIECKNYAIATPIDRMHYANHDNDIPGEGIEESFVKNVVVENVIHRHKKSFYETFLKPGEFDSVDPKVEWEISDHHRASFDSNPIIDVKNWCEIIRKETGKTPNCAIVSDEVFNFLVYHDKIRKFLNNELNNNINRNIIAKKLGLENLYTIGWILNEEGDKYMDCNSFLLYYNSKFNHELEIVRNWKPTAMLKLMWSNFHGANVIYNCRILKWEDISRRSFIIAPDIVFGLKILCKELGRVYTPKESINND